MAGIAGKLVRRGRINTIIGLDPAGPLFSVNTPADRLDLTDANYVEAVHTNGGAFGSGIGAPIAHADFFPNGGSIQPGCILNTCSHMRAVDLYGTKLKSNKSNFQFHFAFQLSRSSATASSPTDATQLLKQLLAGAHKHQAHGSAANHRTSIKVFAEFSISSPTIGPRSPKVNQDRSNHFWCDNKRQRNLIRI